MEAFEVPAEAVRFPLQFADLLVLRLHDSVHGGHFSFYGVHAPTEALVLLRKK